MFDSWLDDLTDPNVKTAIIVHIQRLEDGNFGDVRSVGEGVHELRIHMGAGWRLYFVRRGAELVILLCGGSKRSQARDISRAKALAAEYKDIKP